MISGSALSSFVPVRLAALLREPAGLPAERDATGAVLFADIAGSVDLAERLLAQHGDAGVDELSDALNLCFGALIDQVHAMGGEIVQFAGDALVAVWLADTDALEPAVVAAGRAAVALNTAMATRADLVALGVTMRAGVGAGFIHAARVGATEARWEIVVSGAAVDDAFRATAAAPRGASVFAASAQAAVRAPLTGKPLDGGFMHVTAIAVAAAALATPPAPDATDDLRALVPEAIRARVDQGLDRWLAEMRRVAVMFVKLRGLRPEDVDGLARLHGATSAIAAAIAANNGYFRQLSVDDKGVIIVAAFGVPPLRREWRADDALRAAERIRSDVAALGIETSIGIATGRVFCGVIGNAVRRDYAMVGSTVNRAARFMGIAGAGIVCDAATHSDAVDLADFGAMEPVKLKGFDEPVRPYRLSAMRAPVATSPSNDRQAPGRDEEIATVLAALAAARSGATRTVVIEATPGMGKSTLLSATIGAVTYAGYPVLSGSATWNGQSTPYHAWIPIVEQLLGIANVRDDAARVTAARAILAADPLLDRDGPLLNDILHLGLEETAYTSGLDGVDRADNTRALIVRLLLRHRGDNVMLVAVDDAQWCDAGSWSLIVECARATREIVVVLAARPLESVPVEAQALLSQPATQRIRLKPLRDDAIGNAAASAAGVRTLDPELVSWIAERSAGNPFFARQLTLSLVQTGHLLVENGSVTRSPRRAELEGLALPASVEALVLSRVDALAPVPQVVLKTASVIGPRFTLAELDATYPLEEQRDHLGRDIDELIAAQLVVTRDAGYAFAHQIVLDVAYGTMVGAQRKTAHERVAVFLEQANAGTLEPVYERLAHHWEAAAVDAPTFKYLELAGAKASRKGAFRDAMASFRRALALDVRRGKPIEPTRRAKWLRQLGDAHDAMGELSEAAEQMGGALVELGRPMPSTNAGWRLALMREMSRQISHLVKPPRPFPAGSAEWDRASEIARACTSISEVKSADDKPLGAGVATFAAANACDFLGMATGVARPVSVMGYIFELLGARGIARRYFERARLVAQTAGDTAGAVRVDLTQGTVEFWRGNFGASEEMIDRARRVSLENGFGREYEMSEGMAFNASLARARFDEHRARGFALLDLSRERGRTLGQVWALLALAGDHVRTDQLDAAAGFIAEIRQHQKLRSMEQVMCDGWDLAVQVGRGDWDRARALAEIVAGGLGIARLGQPKVGRIILFSHWQPFWCYSEARLALLQHASADERAVAMADAEQACKAHRSYGNSFAVGLPGALLFSGLLTSAQGKHAKGLRLVQRAAAAAETFDMPFERARALESLRELGQPMASTSA